MYLHKIVVKKYNIQIWKNERFRKGLNKEQRTLPKCSSMNFSSLPILFFSLLLGSFVAAEKQQPEEKINKPDDGKCYGDGGCGRHPTHKKPIKKSSSSSSSSEVYEVIRKKPPMHKHSSSSSSDDKPKYESVQLIPDVGYFTFTFGEGNSGNYAYQSFFFSLPTPAQFQVTDCFCGGDRFIVHDMVGGATYAAVQPCDAANLSCNFYSQVPYECMTAAAGWCKSGWVNLPAGFHNLTIEIVTAPFLSGTGFIILQSLCTVANTPVPCCSLTDTGCEYGVYC